MDFLGFIIVAIFRAIFKIFLIYVGAGIRFIFFKIFGSKKNFYHFYYPYDHNYRTNFLVAIIFILAFIFLVSLL
jgi:hypothetical protein